MATTQPKTKAFYFTKSGHPREFKGAVEITKCSERTDTPRLCFDASSDEVLTWISTMI